MTRLRERLGRVDARWFVLANNTILLAAGTQRFGLQRDGAQIALGIAAPVLAELACAFAFKKHASVSIPDRVLSALVLAVSTLILVRSSGTWFYAGLASLAVLSKYVLLDERGRHMFNPTNFAIVFALAFLPDDLFVRPDQFSTVKAFWALIGVFGVLAALRGARWRVTAGYYATIFCIGLPLGTALGVKPLWILAPELNTSTLIFAFLMQTDPRTSPASRLGQALFGACIAGVHLYLRYTQVPYSPFVALFAVTAAASVLRPKVAPAAVPMLAPQA